MTEEQRLKRNARQRRYQSSDKGRATWERYNSSDRARESWRRYQLTEKGRARSEKYRQSEAGQIIAYLHARTPEVRLMRRLAAQERTRG